MRTKTSKYGLIIIIPMLITILFVIKKVTTTKSIFQTTNNDYDYDYDISLDVSTLNSDMARIDSFMFLLILVGIGIGLFFKNKLNQ